MKYVFYNIRNLARREKLIFAVMLLCVFVSAWIMTFSYGVYHNYNEMLKEPAEELGDTICPDIAEGRTLTRGDLVKYLTALSPETLDAMRLIVTESGFNYKDDITTMENAMVSRFVIQNGAVIPSPYIVDLWSEKKILVSGRYISDTEEANGERVIIVEQDMKPSKYPNMFIDKETVIINGTEYKVIGNHKSYGVIVPLLTIPEDATVRSPSMNFAVPVTSKQYKDLKDTAERAVPGLFVFPDIKFAEDDQALLIYNNMLAVAVLIAALAIINFAFLYNFILQRRSRTLAIMRICGCTKGKARLICLGECCVICIPTFLIGLFTYDLILHSVLGRLFKYIEEAYSLAVYGLLFAIFVAVLLIIMSILLTRSIRRELAESRKGGAV